MKSPYDILGVTPNSSEEEIQNAYRREVSENEDNPDKIKIINEAYDQVILAKRNVDYTPILDGIVEDETSEDSYFPDVRRLIEQGRFLDADEILNGVPLSGQESSGEWNFLKGTVCYNRGMIDSAANYFAKAYNLEPNNKEFYEAMAMTQNSQKNAAYDGVYSSCMGDCCTQLACASCITQCCCRGGLFG